MVKSGEFVTMALSKGRILEDTLPFLKGMGINLIDDPEKSRKLIIGTSDPRLRIIIVRASDVPTYVQRGAADLGVAGKDVLLEHDGEGLFEPLDLGIARCKLMVAVPEGMITTMSFVLERVLEWPPNMLKPHGIISLRRESILI